jgi:hypothetical protein
VERFEKGPVDAGGRPDPRDPGESGLRAGVKNETSGNRDGRELERPRMLFRFRRKVKSEAPGRGPVNGLPVPLGEAHPDVPDPHGRRGLGHLGKKVRIGAEAPSLLPEKQRIEPDRNAKGVPDESGQPGELGQSLAIVRHSRLNGRPTQPRDRDVQIELVIADEKVLQSVSVVQEVRKILGPKDDRMNGLGGQIDRVDTALRSDNMGPPLAQGLGQPFRKGGDEVGAPRGADDGFQGPIPAGGKAGRRASPRGRT